MCVYVGVQFVNFFASHDMLQIPNMNLAIGAWYSKKLTGSGAALSRAKNCIQADSFQTQVEREKNWLMFKVELRIYECKNH